MFQIKGHNTIYALQSTTVILRLKGPFPGSKCYNNFGNYPHHFCLLFYCFCCVNHSVVSCYLWTHELQLSRLPRPLRSLWVCSDSCPLSQWCHPTISSSVTTFPCPQSFPASGSFPMSRLLVFWLLSFKPAFSLSSFTLIKSLFSSSSLSALGWYHLHIWGYWYFSWKSWFQLVLHLAQHVADIHFIEVR